MARRNESSGVKAALSHDSPGPSRRKENHGQDGDSENLIQFSPDLQRKELKVNQSGNDTSGRDRHKDGDKRGTPIGSDRREGDMDYDLRDRRDRPRYDEEMDFDEQGPRGTEGQRRDRQVGRRDEEDREYDQGRRGTEGQGRDRQVEKWDDRDREYDQGRRGTEGTEGQGRDRQVGRRDEEDREYYQGRRGTEGQGRDRQVGRRDEEDREYDQGRRGTEGQGRDRQVEERDDRNREYDQGRRGTEGQGRDRQVGRRDEEDREYDQGRRGTEGQGRDRQVEERDDRNREYDQGRRGTEGQGRDRQVEQSEPWWMQIGKASSCCRLAELRRLTGGGLGPLRFSSSHIILIEVDTFNNRAKLVPQQGRDLWHKNFVKLPSSDFSFVNVKSSVLKTPTQKCRWDVLCRPLKDLAKKKSVKVDDVKDAIVKYNPKYKDQWSFDALQHFVQCSREGEHYERLFAKIAELALSLPENVKKAIPLLQRGHAATITLSQVQISCLLANAFFCTFPHRNASSPASEYHNYPTINFNSLFGNKSARKNEKLRAILHYFSAVTDRKPVGLVTFERRVLRDGPKWESCEEKMAKLYVASSGAIEKEGQGMLQVDFAASMVGGGVLGNGMLQEEILFLVNPELIVSRLFTERLADDECLLITGCQQFSSYSGYADRFQWQGNCDENTRRDDWGRMQRQIVAMDAMNFKYKSDQYTMNNIKRELNKAYCSFKRAGSNEPDIATGKWGCGAFNGDPHLKAVIQLMAAAKAQRGLAFFTFGDEELKRDLELIYHLMVTEKTTVGRLFRLLRDYCAIVDKSRVLPISLFDFLSKNIRGPGDKLQSPL